jgi:hypothetical protein
MASILPSSFSAGIAIKSFIQSKDKRTSREDNQKVAGQVLVVRSHDRTSTAGFDVVAACDPELNED